MQSMEMEDDDFSSEKTEFSMYGLRKVRSKHTRQILVVMGILLVVLLVISLIVMSCLYHIEVKTNKQKKTVFIPVISANEKEFLKDRFTAYKRIESYGEDCHATSTDQQQQRTRCTENAYCRYFQGTYRCDCKKGFVGDGIGDCRDSNFSIKFINPTKRNIPELKQVSFPETNELTVCFWYKLSSLDKKWHAVFMYTSLILSTSNDLMIWMNGRGEIHVTIGNTHQLIVKEKLTIGQWTHFCWSWESSGNWTVYIAGKRLKSNVENKYLKSFIGKLPNSLGSFLLGQDKDQNKITDKKQMFRGELTQLFLYKRALTSDEIYSAYQNRPSTDDIIVGWWQFRDLTMGSDIIQTAFPF